MKKHINNITAVLPGLFVSLIIACAAKYIESLLPIHVVGASVIALFTGMIINSFWSPARIAKGLKFTSKKVL